MKNFRLKFLATVILFAICLIPYAQTVYYVKSGATGQGTSWADASGNIQDMIDLAGQGDEIWVAAGIYHPTKKMKNTERSRTFLIDKGISLYGGFAGTETSLEQRILTDLDSNGIIEPWEFENTTVLSGDLNGDDSWVKEYNSEVEGSWTWNVNGYEDNVYRIIHSRPEDGKVVIDGVTISGGFCGWHDHYVNMLSEDYKNPGIIYAGKNTDIQNIIVKNNFRASENSPVYSGSEFTGEYGIITISSGFLKDNNNNFSNSLIEKNHLLGEDWENEKVNTGPRLIYAAGVNNFYNCIIRENSGIDTPGFVSANKTSFSDLQVYNNSITNTNLLRTAGGMIQAYPYSLLINSVFFNNIVVTKYNINGGILNIGPISFTYNNLITNNTIIANGDIQGGILATGDAIPNNFTIVNNRMVSLENNILGGTVYHIQELSSGEFNIVNNITISNEVTAEQGEVKGYDHYVSLFEFSDLPGIYNFTHNILSREDAIYNSLEGISENNFTTDFFTLFKNPTLFTGIAQTDAEKEEILFADWTLTASSPAIDTGTTTGLKEDFLNGTDLAGNPRIINQKVDIGAYEYQVLPTLMNTLSTGQKFIYHIIDDWLYVDNPSTVTSIQLFDISRQMVSTSKDNKIQLPGRGIYILKARTATEEISGKIIW